MGQKLARVQLVGSGCTTLIRTLQLHVDGQAECGIPICELCGCKLPIELGACKKHSTHKHAYCAKHHKQHKLFSSIGEPSKTSMYTQPISIQPAAFMKDRTEESVHDMSNTWCELYCHKAGGLEYTILRVNANFLSIFNSPSGHLNTAVEAMAMTCLPPLDT